MHKIFMNITLTNSTATAEQVVDAFMAVISPETNLAISTTQVDVKPVPTGSSKLLVLQFDTDETADYYTDNAVGQSVPVDEYTLQNLRTKGVCTKLVVRHPRADKYGPSGLAQQGEAEGFVDEQLFAISPDFEVEFIDTGDDSGESYEMHIVC